MAKRQFVIDLGEEKIPVEGHQHRNVAVKYLMKRRRSILMTRDPEKAEKMFEKLPREFKVVGKQLSKKYRVKWEKVGTQEFQGSRFTFTMEEENLPAEDSGK